MSRKLIRLIILIILSTAVQVQAIGGDAYHGGSHEQFSEAMIVSQDCKEPLSKLMREMIKYYIDRGDYESADALIKVAKKSLMAGIRPPGKVPQSKQGNANQDDEYLHHWIFGYF